MIRETIVTTLGKDGTVHIAPIGLIQDGTICRITATQWPTSPTTC
jgi:hypothetical protein